MQAENTNLDELNARMYVKCFSFSFFFLKGDSVIQLLILHIKLNDLIL